MERPLRKKDVPAALNEIMTSNCFKKNLISGFQACGLFPFDPDAINYVKYLPSSAAKNTEKMTEQTPLVNITASETTLQLLEAELGKRTILDTFNGTYIERKNWEGDVSYLQLYNFWKKVKDSVCRLEVANINSESEVPLDVIEFEFPEWDNNDVEQITAGETSISSIPDAVEIATHGVNGTKEANCESIQNSPTKDILQTHKDDLKKQPGVAAKEITELVNNNSNSLKQNGDVGKIRILQQIVLKPSSSDVPHLESISLHPENKKSVSDILKNVWKWPDTAKSTKRKRDTLKLPSVLTSNKWLEIVEARDREVLEANEEKKKRKEMREQKKQDAQEKKLKKKSGKILKSDSESKTADININEIQLEVGCYVIVQYDDQFYPAKVVEVDGSNAKCEAMEKSGINWKWPCRSDIIWYSLQDILQKISPPKILNSRGIYTIPEMENYLPTPH